LISLRAAPRGDHATVTKKPRRVTRVSRPSGQDNLPDVGAAEAQETKKCCSNLVWPAARMRQQSNAGHRV